MTNVLIVDDDPDYGSYLEALLQRAGFACEVASSGRDALARLSGGAFDAAITDIYMPELDGVEFVRDVSRRHREVALLAVTGGRPDVTDPVSRIMIELGVRRVFAKPVDAGALVETLHSAVARG
jgi:DNA-binding response OmpR family regulator